MQMSQFGPYRFHNFSQEIVRGGGCIDRGLVTLVIPRAAYKELELTALTLAHS
jgi:hypothetical protein